MKNLIKHDFSRYSVPDLIALTMRVIKNQTNNPDFVTLQNEMAPLQQAEDDLKNANSGNGGLQQTEIVAANRVTLTTLLDSNATDVETVCVGNRAKALGSGHEVSKETAVKKVMPVKVTNVEAKTSLTNGTIDLDWSQEVNRVIYRIEMAQVIAGNTPVFVSAGYITKLKFSVTGLSAGVTYQFRVISINNLGESIPSDVATAMSL